MSTSLIVAALVPLAALALLPLVLEVCSRVRAARADRPLPGTGRARVLLLMPAHDEALLMGAAARALRALAEDVVSLRSVVIADNCSDETARIARQEGVEVFERFDAARRGKPAAIRWAIDTIGLEEFDAVAIVDADSEIDAGFFSAAADFADLRRIAVQGYFGVSNLNASWLSRLGDLLSRVRYDSEYLLKDRAGLNVPLTGNGMLIGVELFQSAGWPEDALTENWDLYARYTARGARIRLARGAMLRAQESTTLASGSTQRRRWMAGRLQVLRRHTTHLIVAGVRRRDFLQLLDTMLELVTPGPVLQLALAAALAFVSSIVATGWTRVVLASLFLSSVLPLAIRVADQWRRHPLRWRLAADLLRLPVYLVWRIATAVLSIATARSGRWERSPREP